MELFNKISYRCEDEDYEIRILYDGSLINVVAFRDNHPVNGFRYMVKLPKKLDALTILQKNPLGELVETAKRDIREKRWEAINEYGTVRIIVTGSSGMLAGDLIPELEQSGFAVVRYDLPEYDITDGEKLSNQIKTDNPSLIINCAAYTAVDKAESEPQKAYAVNCDGVKNLAAVCKAVEIPLVHISTDYLFDGEKEQPYTETDRANPLSVYGQSKLEGEGAVRSILPNHLILRTAWLYGVHGGNFVKTILRLAREKDVLRIIDDQFGCPTWSGDLSRIINNIIQRLEKVSGSNLWGTYHVCATGKTSWYGFACAIIDEARKYEKLAVREIIPISTKEYPLPAKRPPMSVLDIGKLTQIFEINPLPWQEGLKRMFEKYYKDRGTE